MARHLLDLVAPDRTPAREVITATPEIVPAWGAYDFPSVPHWRNGNMVIIGDAAHAASPASGQGASMAIEDSIVLAQRLRDISGVPAALAAYERQRRDRVERVVAMGKSNGDAKAVGPFGRMLRDVVLPVVFKRRARTRPDRWVSSISWTGTPRWRRDATLRR